MSTHDVVALVSAAQRDPALARALARAAESHGGEEALAAVAAEARTRGFDIGGAEILGHQRARAGEGGDGPLSDEALDGVAGGGQIGGPVGKALDWITDLIFGPEGSH